MPRTFVLAYLMLVLFTHKYSFEGGHKSELSQPKAKPLELLFQSLQQHTQTHTGLQTRTHIEEYVTHMRTNTRTVSEGLTSGHVVIGDFHGVELQAFRLVRRAQHHVYKHSGRCLNTH